MTTEKGGRFHAGQRTVERETEGERGPRGRVEDLALRAGLRVKCFVYAGCKLAGLAWAADRPWGEVIFFLFVAAGIFAAFGFRKKIAAAWARFRDKLGK